MTTMTASDGIELKARRLIEGVWNGEEPSVADELVSSSFVLPGHEIPGEITGPELYKHLAEQTRSVFPDVHYAIEDVLVDGSRVAVRWTMTGTHEGVVFGVAPTGEKVQIPGIEIDRFEDGQLVAAWIQTDELGILEQIGGLPPV